LTDCNDVAHLAHAVYSAAAGQYSDSNKTVVQGVDIKTMVMNLKEQLAAAARIGDFTSILYLNRSFEM